MLRISLAGEEAVLHPSGAMFLPEHHTLLVADAHVGKAVSYRKLGVPVPEATTGATLQALTDALVQTGARRLVFLGDFLHSARSHAPATLAALDGWRDRHATIELTLVRGNHDDRAGDPPARLGIRAVDEPLSLGPFALRHHPEPVGGAYVLAGHWHPCISIRGRAFERLRLPCFWLGDDSGELPPRAVGVLPAFGSFTGMHRIEPGAGDRIFPVAEGVVRALPALPVA
ncbi:MAG TPA: ligase-associated DNA damage response endonuclease PdeM [Ramlibacter sp.]|jgi:DNA ligase-associated metallophosphoesterase|uniref:ligase-associated DNA damage response endonuclease PdeM n=1 Tax=Ramlibacter sp. TaxID=1917967 RepID=UPI002D61FC04|nr:ligase-associated DNA damage response endonuclease PdeM [Ramlibacter sp.]HZY17476.1 ligase-associated DNA damage response endonuclease PdeM [Ramlibacter sp.]